jgi:hypothetical protein
MKETRGEEDRCQKSWKKTPPLAREEGKVAARRRGG